MTKFCKLVRHAETELPLTHAAFREGREKTRAAAPERKRVLEKQSREKRQKANKQATQLHSSLVAATMVGSVSRRQDGSG